MWEGWRSGRGVARKGEWKRGKRGEKEIKTKIFNCLNFAWKSLHTFFFIPETAIIIISSYTLKLNNFTRKLLKIV